MSHPNILLKIHDKTQRDVRYMIDNIKRVLYNGINKLENLALDTTVINEVKKLTVIADKIVYPYISIADLQSKIRNPKEIKLGIFLNDLTLKVLLKVNDKINEIMLFALKNQIDEVQKIVSETIDMLGDINKMVDIRNSSIYKRINTNIKIEDLMQQFEQYAPLIQFSSYFQYYKSRALVNLLSQLQFQQSQQIFQARTRKTVIEHIKNLASQNEIIDLEDLSKSLPMALEKLEEIIESELDNLKFIVTYDPNTKMLVPLSFIHKPIKKEVLKKLTKKAKEALRNIMMEKIYDELIESKELFENMI